MLGSKVRLLELFPTDLIVLGGVCANRVLRFVHSDFLGECRGWVSLDWFLIGILWEKSGSKDRRYQFAQIIPGAISRRLLFFQYLVRKVSRW